MTHLNWPAPLAGDRPFMTDGGLETTLIFHEGIDLPYFAAFDLLKDEGGTAVLRDYYESYVPIARDNGVGLILDTPTWRANPDWGPPLKYSADGLLDADRRAVGLMQAVRAAHSREGVPTVIEGAIGPRGDGYQAQDLMTADEAALYHSEQIRAFKDSGVDLVTAWTLTYAEEAIGIVRAAVAVGVPVAISFTVETDGRLPSGQSLPGAIQQVDEETAWAAVCFMVNCAHPSHFADVLTDEGEWRERIGGIRANASKRSHAELDQSEELDDGDPVELAEQYRALRARLPNLKIIGGCCGTDQRHLAQIAQAWHG